MPQKCEPTAALLSGTGPLHLSLLVLDAAWQSLKYEYGSSGVPRPAAIPGQLLALYVRTRAMQCGSGQPVPQCVAFIVRAWRGIIGYVRAPVVASA